MTLKGEYQVVRAPLWLQLVVLWGAAITLSALLIGMDRLRAGPYKFFWLIPYQNLRLVRKAIVSVFRAKPLLAAGMLLVPALAILGTTALLPARMIALLLPVRYFWVRAR
jgi:hypothetical protein